MLAILALLSLLTPAQAQHVVVVGYDGLSPDGLRRAKIPVIDSVRAGAAWTYHARGVIPTVSSPNWASMIMGAGPAQHGVTSNEWMPDKFEISPVCVGPGGIFPTLFGTLRRQRPKSVIAIFHDWAGYGRLVEKGVPDVLQHQEGAEPTMRAAVAWLAEHSPDLMFVHLDLVDHAGHEFGHGSPEYYAAVSEADRLTGLLVEALKKRGLWDSTVVLLTADHGGLGKKHGGNTMAELEIPWIIRGPGIAAGREITTPVNTYDTAPTLARVLGIDPDPCWIGRAVASAFR